MNIAKASEAAKQIQILLLDIDGVLTDGKLYYGSGGAEFKAFNVKDGLGIKLLQRAGVEVGVITARQSEMVIRRCAELGIETLIQGREDKRQAFSELIATTGWPLEQIAYMGDDLPDLAIINQVGLGMTVADASKTVCEQAKWQSRFKGGDGAVREAAEFILQAQGKLVTLLASYG